jgi:HEAT repeat protein/type 1 glutamine amidotransferase
MKRSCKVLVAVLAVFLGLLFVVQSVSAQAQTVKALIVTGQNNHNWQVSSPILKQILEQTGLFEVDVATSPGKGGDIETFRPNFAGYGVVVLDYNGELWPEQTRTAFVDYVRSGGGVVVYHAANNSFAEWQEYNQIIGLGGWGGRDEKSGAYVRWRKGKAVRDMSPGRGGSHGPRHDIQITVRNKNHSITKDLPDKWMHAEDELYSRLRGPAEHLSVLATAYDSPAQKGTGEHEPVLFTVRYGKGRVFHTVLGHVGRSGGRLPAMECVGFITTFQRGAEWAATGRVTQKVPEDFPTQTEVRRWKDSIRPRPLAEMLSEISKYEHGQSRRPLTELTELVSSASGSAKAMKRIETSFIEFLGSNAAPAGKQFICRKLSVVGTKESVPTLAGMLTEKATSPIEPADMARYALERIPGPQASKALRDALPKTSGTVKVGIINSLGARGDRKAVKQLSKLISDSDKQVAEAALSALGKIGGRQAAKALKAGESKIDAGLRPVWADAYLMCADKFLAKNKTKPALAIYRQLYVPEEGATVRIGALRGLVKAEPDSATETVVGVLKGDDQMLQAAAIGLLAEIPGDEVVKAVTAELGNLSVKGQVQVLSALGVRGDRSALPAVLEAAGSSDVDVRIAAYGAIAKLGDASNVDFLAQKAATTEGAEQQAAREALYSLRGQEVDKKILAGIGEAEPKVKVELIRAVGERNITAAVKTLLQTAWAREPEVRLESLKALKVIAAETDLPALVALVLYAKAGADRIEAENTVAAVARKIEDKEHRAGGRWAPLRFAEPAGQNRL